MDGWPENRGGGKRALSGGSLGAGAFAGLAPCLIAYAPVYALPNRSRDQH